MAVIDVLDDPEAVLRKKIGQRTAAAGTAVATPDPVYDTLYNDVPPPPPAVSAPTPPPAPSAVSAPTGTPPPAPTPSLAVTPSPYQTLHVGDDDGGGPTPTTPTPTTPTTPAPAPAPPGMTVDHVLPDGRTVYRDQYGQLFTANPGSVTGYDIYTPPVTTPTTPGYGATWTDPGFIGWADFFTGGGEGKNPTFGGNYQGFFNAMFPGDTLTPAMLKAKEQQLLSAGIKLMPNAAGVVGKIQLPNGQIIDVIQGAESGVNRRQWLIGGGGSGGGGGGVPSTQPGFQEELRKILRGRLAKAMLPVNETDPYISEPFGAARLQAGREQQRERTALAERLNATGDTSRSLEMGLQQSAERNAVGLGTFKGKLIQDEYNRRSQELMDLMTMALQNSDAQAMRDIQAAQIALDQARWEATHNASAGG